MANVQIKSLEGKELNSHIEDLAQLRIQVFKDFPYLYEGSLDYEKSYLASYQQSELSKVFIAFDGDRPIGASTCNLLANEEQEFKDAVESFYPNLEKVFYFGESVLLKEYRGRGIGKDFFQLREAHAKKSLGSELAYTCFCSVVRSPQHPLKPTDYRALDPFWESQGYTKQAQVIADFKWKDIDQEKETEKQLVFWFKDWKGK